MITPWPSRPRTAFLEAFGIHPRSQGRRKRDQSFRLEPLEDRTVLSPVMIAGDRRGRLFTVDVATGDVTVRGQMSRPMFDLAFDPSGNLYAVDQQSVLFRVNPETGATTRVGRVGAVVNALVFAPDGTLYGAGRTLVRIDPETGAGTRIGSFRRLISGGDLAFSGTGELYMTTGANQLARVNRETGAAQVVGRLGFQDVFGLGFGPDGVMYGLSDRSQQIVSINLATGRGTAVSRFAGRGALGANGAGFLEESVTPGVSISDTRIVEGNEGTRSAVFTVSLTSAVGRVVDVQYQTATGSATAGVDFVTTSGTLRFNPGQTTATISVPIVGDTTYEPDETFSVNLSAAVNATIVDPQAQAVILNDDPVPSISISDYAELEGNTTLRTFAFTVYLSNTSSQTISVNYATDDDTAIFDSNDYIPATGTLTFAPGELSKVISVSVVGDFLFEPDEFFLVLLSNPVNATILQAVGVGTILNDDTNSIP